MSGLGNLISLEQELSWQLHFMRLSQHLQVTEEMQISGLIVEASEIPHTGPVQSCLKLFKVLPNRIRVKQSCLSHLILSITGSQKTLNIESFCLKKTWTPTEEDPTQLFF